MMRIISKTGAAGMVAIGTTSALALLALANRYLATKAEHENPAVGQFIEVDGVLLHYVDRGEGPVVVFLHGNGSMIADFDCSGILDAVSAKFRIIAFDRPGFGYSTRPGKVRWTPEQQAALVEGALTQLGIEQAIFVGHSWGTLVALAFARENPEAARGLILISGYYFPSPRADAAIASVGALPGLGDLLCHTVLPFMGRLMWRRLISKLFRPVNVPRKWRGFSKEMALRPSQLRASAEESAMMMLTVRKMASEYRQITVPVSLIAGAGDQIVDPKQSSHLHETLADSNLATLLFQGHMVHHTATSQVVTAMDEIDGRSKDDTQGAAE
jgi:pimeloyl-ACP methyl ester carboxylesterase